MLIDAPTQARSPVDAIRILVERLSVRYDIRGLAASGSHEKGVIRREGTLNLVVVLNHEMVDPAQVALDMGWDALELYLQSGVHITPVPVFYDHWRDPAAAPDPDVINRAKLKAVWLWL